MPSCAAMAPIAQHRGGDAQLACDLDQRPTAARQQGDRLPLELIRKMTPFLAHSTPFRSRRSLAKVSTNSGEAQVPTPRSNASRTSELTRSAISPYLGAQLRLGAKLMPQTSPWHSTKQTVHHDNTNCN